MRQTLHLAFFLLISASLTAQTDLVKEAVQRIKELNHRAMRTAIPQNYTDYGYDWNSATSAWDTTRIAKTTFSQGSAGVDMHSTGREFDEGLWEDSDWITYYNINMDDPYELDKLTEYVYFPADSFKAVYYDVYLFGTLPLTVLYFRGNQGRLERVETYYDYSLTEPGGIRLLIDIQINHYNEEGILEMVSFEGPYTGIDETSLQYDMDGRLISKFREISLYSSEPEETEVTRYGYDSDGLLSHEVIEYYYENSPTPEFRDSTYYLHTGENKYEEYFYYSFIEGGELELGEYFKIDNSDDFVHTHEVWNSTGEDFELTQRITRNYNNDLNLTDILTEKANGINPLGNSNLLERIYETTVSSSDPVSDSDYLVYYDGASFQVKGDIPNGALLKLYATNGSLLHSANVMENRASSPLDLSSGMYFVTLGRDKSGLMHSQGIWIVN